MSLTKKKIFLGYKIFTDSYRQPWGLDSASLCSASLDARWAVCSLGKNYVKIYKDFILSSIYLRLFFLRIFHFLKSPHKSTTILKLIHFDQCVMMLFDEF